MQYQKLPRSRHPIHFETVAQEPASSIRAVRSGGGQFRFNLHYHPELELTLILRGHGLRFVGDSIEEFADGDLCLIGGGLLHTWQSHTTSVANEAIVVQFRREVLRPLEAAWPEARSLSALLDRSACGLRLLDSDRRIGAAMEELAELPTGSLDSMAQFLRLLRLASGAAQQEALAVVPAPAGPADDVTRQLNRVLQHVHAHLAEPLTLAEVAEVAGLTPTSFSRFFSRLVGKTFTRYINEWRIRIACQKLIETQLAITDIAFTCGFENLSNFNRRFRQFKFTTPREYRARQARPA